MARNTRPVSLKVEDSHMEAGRGVIWVNPGVLEALGASAGDVLEVMGKRRTVAKGLPLGDQKKRSGQAAVAGLLHPVYGGVARMDRLTMENARVAVGDSVTLRKVKALPARYVELMPLAVLSEADARFIELALNGVPVMPGDVVVVPQAEASKKERYFRVIRLGPPSGQAVLMVSTIFHIV